MQTKLKLLMLLAFISSSAFAQQTQCDSLYIKIAGMNASQMNMGKISLKIDVVKLIKYVYLNRTGYSIEKFTLSSNVPGNQIEVINKGPKLDKNSLLIISTTKVGRKIYFDSFEIKTPLGTILKCPNLNLMITVI